METLNCVTEAHERIGNATMVKVLTLFTVRSRIGVWRNCVFVVCLVFFHLVKSHFKFGAAVYACYYEEKRKHCSEVAQNELEARYKLDLGTVSLDYCFHSSCRLSRSFHPPRPS